jgi:adenine C2-methylase RlmN of 23S rRNA A2503 and tRNA A37
LNRLKKQKNTPSSKWEQQRKKDIEKFKKEIINSDLFVNLKNNFGEDIDEDKIMVIDHEE